MEFSDTLVIPASRGVLMIDRSLHQNIRAVTFEADSKVRRIQKCAFWRHQNLETIAIPSSVESIGERALASPALRRVTFEPGSHLTKIAKEVFSGCSRLRSLCLPASLRTIDGSAFRGSGLSKLTVAPGNTHFRVQEKFLVNFHEVCLVLYFGKDRGKIRIPDEIETIGERAFYFNEFIESISFNPSSKLRVIREAAFLGCPALKGIDIPPGVLRLDDAVFRSCKSLFSVDFGSNSVLARINQSAFATCWALSALTIPGTVEFIGPLCFDHCGKLSDLRLGNPSHLRELHSWPTHYWQDQSSLSVPNALEVLEIIVPPKKRWLMINCGEKSRLQHLRLVGHGARDPVKPQKIRVCVRIPGCGLKALRYNREFG
jgi:hypothetical protein